MSEAPPTLGDRVAYHRKLRGLSQVELGRLIGRSEGWVSQVERGVRKIDRMSVLESLAETLNVPVAELAPTAPVAPTAESAAWWWPLRLAITGHPALAALVAPGRTEDDTTEARARERVDGAWALVHASHYSEAVPALADLIGDLEHAARLAPPAERAGIAAALSSAYQAAGALFAKAGDTEAGWVAADRALFAAERAGDPALVAASQHRLALTLLGAGRLEQARHAATIGATVLRANATGRDVAVTAVLGALHLVQAVAAARAGDRTGARALIAETEVLADAVGPGRNDYNTEFGPANVAMHAVAIAVELGDAGEALDRASRIDVSGLSPERRARFLVDVARAHAQRRDRREAVASLLEAEQIAPEQIRDHGRVRTLVRDLLQGADRPAEEELRGLAERCGVPA
ncbi:helix-turn-helix transcriptional regulator [Pseudofrankia sp. DC12]|uniref:helix-turn-helix domain-containing protein n=1 Tax=Pseudofrankia sp. DC12 TaxID=683315 RepID=UPI0005F7F393|nr:helix-turn-helix transcriptional regulator [Pseudofrankia sp. DC12]